MSNTMNFPLNDHWHEVIFVLNEISLFIKRTHMIACNASTENVASWQVIDYILVLYLPSPDHFTLWFFSFILVSLVCLPIFFFNPHWEPFHRLNLWRSNCGVNLKCIILIFQYLAWKSMWPYARFLISTPSPWNSSSRERGRVYEDPTALLNGEDIYTSILEQFNMNSKY